MNKEIFKSMGGGSQFVFLSFIVIGYLFLAVITSTIVMYIFNKIDIAYTSELRILQLIQAGMLFILPAILFAELFNDSGSEYLKIRRKPKIQILLIVLVIVIISQPFLHLVSHYNSLMILPESMSGIQEWMLESEMKSKEVIKLLLEDKTLGAILSNIFIIAIVAGVTEEFLFRGCLQQVLKKWTGNAHVAIWLTAIIFSFIHFQFYGFFTRMIAGALLGYLFYWSRNLWVPILAHIMHNLINILLASYYISTPLEDEMENMAIDKHQWLGIASFAILLLICYTIHRKKIFQKITKKEVIKDY